MNLDNGHAINGAGWIIQGSRVHYIVGPDDHYHIGLGHIGIDLIHFNQFFIRHIGFCKQDVHVAGHPSSHRVYGVLHFYPVGFEQLVQFAADMLCLCHRKSVSRYNNHLTAVIQHHGGIVGRDLLHGAMFSVH